MERLTEEMSARELLERLKKNCEGSKCEKCPFRCGYDGMTIAEFWDIDKILATAEQLKESENV